MSTQLEETAILGLRAQIFDNLLLIKYETEDPIITTSCGSRGWYAAFFSKKCVYPIYGTREGHPTVVAALRSLLKYTSEMVEEQFQKFRDDPDYHDHVSSTDTGIEFKDCSTVVLDTFSFVNTTINFREPNTRTMPATSEETAIGEEATILGLRAQILDNLRIIEADTANPILATCCDAVGRWTAVVYNKPEGPPVHVTTRVDKTGVAALRTMLKYTSEMIDGYVKNNDKGIGLRATHTISGSDFTYALKRV